MGLHFIIIYFVTHSFFNQNWNTMKLLTTFILFAALFFSPELISQTPTWSEDIAPIIYKNCTPCHSNDGVAPFALETYYNAFTWSNEIKNNVQSRNMPPWPPISSYRHYSNERVLNQIDINKIVDWVNGGSPEGNPTQAPPVPTFNRGPLLGTPEMKLTIPTHTSTATTADEYACFVIPTGLTADKFVRGIQVVPGNNSIVHHVIVQLDTSASVNNCYLGLAGAAQTMYSWAAGMSPAVFPNTANLKMGMRIKAGSNILVQIHYPVGSAGKIDSTSVLFYLYSDSSASAPNPPMRELKEDLYVMNWIFAIPANTVQTINASWPLIGNTTQDLSLFAVDPHMHLLGRSTIHFAVTPNGDTIPLNKIDDWRYNWQSYYFFKNLIKVPSGSKIYGSATYDNTVNNPYNPFNPPQLCLPGENTTNEMMLTAYQYAVYEPGDENYDLETMINEAISAATGVEEVNPLQTEMSFAVYPNPAIYGKFALSPVNLQRGKTEVTVSNFIGQPIYSNNFYNLNDLITINIGNQPDGIYLVQVKKDNYHSLQKVILSGM